MLFDSIKMVDGAIDDGVIESGTSFPLIENSKLGQLFYLSQAVNENIAGLYVFDSINWVAASGGNGNDTGNNNVSSGTTLPAVEDSSPGQLFYLSEADGANSKGLYIFDSEKWVPVSKPSSGGGGTVAEPDAVSFTYDEDENVQTMTEVYGENEKVFTYAYNDEGDIHTITSVYLGVTRTETYTYNTNGEVDNMVAVIS